MSNRPVYRYPPRSHAAGCPCDRCAQCRSRPSPGSDLIKFDMGCLGVLLAGAAISAICGWVARNGHIILTALPAAGAAALVIAAVAYLRRRSARPPEGRLKAEAAPQPPVPLLPVSLRPPPCRHLNAVPVDLSTGERVAWLCPECGEGLPAESGRLARPCCGTPPGTRHVYNCPQAQWVP